MLRSSKKDMAYRKIGDAIESLLGRSLSSIKNVPVVNGVLSDEA